MYRTQLHWTATEETGSAFSKLSIVDQNKLVIKKTANYFVYAAVVFDFRTVIKVPQVYYNITSFLPVLPHLQPFVLMGKYGGSPFSEKRHTGYLCGISKFYKGHQISVSVNDHSFIDNTPYANFFGIFRLWEVWKQNGNLFPIYAIFFSTNYSYYIEKKDYNNLEKLVILFCNPYYFWNFVCYYNKRN